MNDFSAIATEQIGRSTSSRRSRLSRAARSIFFFAVYSVYLLLGMGLAQRLVIYPLLALQPSRYRAILSPWLRLQARITLGLARVLANVRVLRQGAIPRESVVVVMNHQSIFDIPLIVSLMTGPYPYLPYRERYRRGIPGISPLVRMTRSPALAQRRSGATPAELAAISAAADEVAAGKQSLVIFPEGHRTRTGDIGPFMKRGLRLILPRAKQPVYCVVVDGTWQARTFADAFLRFADTTVRVTIFGPFAVPADSEMESFIDTLRDRMITALDELRSSNDRTAVAPAEHRVR